MGRGLLGRVDGAVTEAVGGADTLAAGRAAVEEGPQQGDVETSAALAGYEEGAVGDDGRGDRGVGWVVEPRARGFGGGGDRADGLAVVYGVGAGGIEAVALLLELDPRADVERLAQLALSQAFYPQLGKATEKSEFVWVSSGRSTGS